MLRYLRLLRVLRCESGRTTAPRLRPCETGEAGFLYWSTANFRAEHNTVKKTDTGARFVLVSRETGPLHHTATGAVMAEWRSAALFVRFFCSRTSLLGAGWMDGRMDGWMVGWVDAA